MEVGAVKQAFNNEIILLKKNLNQAKIQTIHKLTRKAKTLMEKKAPEALKDKQKRKAESAVKEVLILKKIKARDIARFIVTHTGKLNDYLNKPIIDINKVCARLLLHKALQEKYKDIREKFSNISIKDLFMSRQERRKLKKEAREKQKNKKKGKQNTVNVEGEWDVEATDRSKTVEAETVGDNDDVDDEEMSGDNDTDNDEKGSVNDNAISDKSDVSNESDNEIDESNNKNIDTELKDGDSDDIEDINSTISNKVVRNDKKNKNKPLKPSESEKFELHINKKNNSENKSTKIDKKIKDNKNKNLNEKLQKRKFHKESDDSPAKVVKVVDPFFVTSTGENYMSLVEPRQPDEVKEVHKEGNRKYRRAVMFGHVPKIKPKRNNFQSNNSYNKQDNFDKKTINNKRIDFGEKQNNFTRKEDRRIDKNDTAPEKLHPSWEAKKKQSAILPFQGKKIVFD